MQTPNSPVPTDYSLIVYMPGQDPYPFAVDQDHRPDIQAISLQEAKDQSTRSYQVRGTDLQNWRVVAIPVMNNGNSAVVVIGLPLKGVDGVLAHASLALWEWGY